MKKNISLVLVILVLAGLGIFLYFNYGESLLSLPGEIARNITNVLKGLVGSLAAFGSSISDAFRSAPGLH